MPVQTEASVAEFSMLRLMGFRRSSTFPEKFWDRKLKRVPRNPLNYGELILNRTEKKDAVSGLNQTFQGSDLVIVAHNNGLNAAQTDSLRRVTRAAGIVAKVAKNRLAQLAVKGTNFEVASDLLKGPTVLLFGQDLISSTKAAAEFAKDNPSFVIVGGAYNAKVMDVAEINKLATLPSMDQLRGKLVGILQAPGAQLARLAQAYADKAQ